MLALTSYTLAGFKHPSPHIVLLRKLIIHLLLDVLNILSLAYLVIPCSTKNSSHLRLLVLFNVKFLLEFSWCLVILMRFYFYLVFFFYFIFIIFFECIVENGFYLNTTEALKLNVYVTFQPSLACPFAH